MHDQFGSYGNKIVSYFNIGRLIIALAKKREKRGVVWM